MPRRFFSRFFQNNNMPTSATPPAAPAGPRPALTPAAPAPVIQGAPAPAAAPLPSLTPPAVGAVYVHNESNTCYHVTRVYSDPRLIVAVAYQRYGDGANKVLSLLRFFERLRPATELEIEQLRRALPLIQNARVPASLSNIEQANRTLDQATPEGEGEVGAESDPNGGGGGVNPLEPQIGVVYEPTEQDVFENLTLYPDTETTVNSALRSINNREQMEQIWNISRIQPLTGRCIINFYGPPGCGKTRTARALARKVSKPLYQVDYSEMISKYFGDTAKHIKLAFKQAAERGAVLFFDEADSMLSRRLDMSHDHATSMNQNRNVLMQELDRYNGIVVTATNLFSNFDPALIRRIAKHVEFRLPNKEMRKSIYGQHITNPDRVRDVDWDVVAEASVGFSGGDIFNVIVNAIETVSMDENPDNWYLTLPVIMSEVAKVKEAKAASTKAAPVLKKAKAAPTSNTAPIGTAVVDESEVAVAPKPEDADLASIGAQAVTGPVLGE